MAEKTQTWTRLSVGEFVSEGTMLAVPLCFPGQSVPPPAEECPIASMALDPSGATVYLGTAGPRAHVMSAMLRTDTGVVADLGVVPGATRVAGLSADEEHVWAVGSGPNGSALWRWPRMHREFLMQEWTVPRFEPEKVADLFDESVADAVAVRGGQGFVGVTDPGGRLFRMALDGSEPKPLGQLDEEGRFSRRIGLDPCGRIWASRGRGELCCWHPANGEIVEVGRIPAAAGRGQHTQASAWAIDPRSGAVYGGTTPDGFIFRIEDGRPPVVVALGKPTRLDDVNCLAVGHDGRLFGAAGLAEDIGHVFSHDPETGGSRDLGIPVSALAARQYGYHFACMLTGRDGEVYLGQHERGGHLWIYFPPMPNGHAAKSDELEIPF